MRAQRPAGTPWTAGTVTVLGQDSPLGAEVCRTLTAGGYPAGAAGPRISALIIASELAVPAADAVLGTLAAANADFASMVTGDVEAITGHPATSFSEWVAANVAAFR